MAARGKDVAAARKGGAASPGASSPAGRARGNPESMSPSAFDSEPVDSITGKPLPHYLKPTISSRHDICKYGKRRGTVEQQEQEKNIRRSPTTKLMLPSSPSTKPSAAARRSRSSSQSTSPKERSGKAVATPLTRTESFGRTTTSRTSRPRERQPISAASGSATIPTAVPTTTKKQPTARKNKNVNSSASGGAVVKTVTKVSDSPIDHEEKIEEKTMILEECHGSEEEKSENAVPLEAIGSIPSGEEGSSAVITKTDENATATSTPSMVEPETADQNMALPAGEEIEEPEICTIDRLSSHSSVQEGLPSIDELQDEDVSESVIDEQVDDDTDAEENADAAKNVDMVGEIQGVEKEEKGGDDEGKEEKQEEEEKEDNEENNSPYDEYSDNHDGEEDDDSEEEGQEEEGIKGEETPTGKGEEGREDSPRNRRSGRGTVLSPGDEDDNDKPKKLRSRRERVVDKDGSNTSSRRGTKQKEEAVNTDGGANVATSEQENMTPKANSSQEKKDGTVVFNQVIEETASKLVESRKSKVRALVGAFETVISIHETDAQSSQGHAHT